MAAGVPLPPADALVFTTSRGKPQSRRNALRAVHAARDVASLNAEGKQPVGLHDLRHSFVALALAAGLSLAETAALARHENARVTAQVYAGLAEVATAAAKLATKRLASSTSWASLVRAQYRPLRKTPLSLLALRASRAAL
jgi:integrase